MRLTDQENGRTIILPDWLQGADEKILADLVDCDRKTRRAKLRALKAAAGVRAGFQRQSYPH